MVIAADAGMLSASNLAALDAAELGFIVGSRMTKAPGDLESDFHWHGDVFIDGQIIDTGSPRHANSTVNDVTHRAEPIWDPDEHPNAWRVIWAYSAKRARSDQKTIYAQETRVRAVITGDRFANSLASSTQPPEAASSTRPPWPARKHWSASRAMSPTSRPP